MQIAFFFKVTNWFQIQYANQKIKYEQKSPKISQTHFLILAEDKKKTLAILKLIFIDIKFEFLKLEKFI